MMPDDVIERTREWVSAINDQLSALDSFLCHANESANEPSTVFFVIAKHLKTSHEMLTEALAELKGSRQ